MPEFSFVIPVYNGASHLGECLESLLSQTFRDIEVVCVDDCSTDGSLEALRAIAREDSRVRVLAHPENRGSARARRTGVLASQGSYVLFSDQDDSYERNACETIHRQLRESPVDILQFGTRVINEGGVEQGEIDGLGEWLAPYEGVLQGRAILDECFVNLAFGYSVWNKAYEGGLARRAFAALEDAPVPLGEDNYESFALFYFARTYRGMPEVLYNYHYGRGYTGRQQQSAASFRRTCGLVAAADLIRSFLVAQGSFGEYEATYVAARRHMLHYTFDRWEKEVPTGEQAEALRYLIEAWPYIEVLEYVSAERPRDTAALLEARFGPLDADSDECAVGAPDNAARKELARLRCELEALSEACREKDARVAERRRRFESSRAYRLGRVLTAPLRRIRGE